MYVCMYVCSLPITPTIHRRWNKWTVQVCDRCYKNTETWSAACGTQTQNRRLHSDETSSLTVHATAMNSKLVHHTNDTQTRE